MTLRRLTDAGLAVLLGGVGLAEIWVPLPSAIGQGSPELSTAAVVVVCTALAFRRVRPLGSALVVLFSWPLLFESQPILVLFWGQFVPIAVAVFSVARYGPGRTPIYGGLAAAGTLLYFDLRVEALQSPGEIIFHWMVVTIAWSFGWGLRVLEHRAEESMRHAVQVELASRELAMAAIIEERTRIARELHDVVAHAVSMMVVQAGAAEQVVEDDPERARAALTTIRTTGADALAEMRRVVAMLRDGGEPDLSPQPGIEGLQALIEDARLTGLDAELMVEGTQRPLPAGLDLAAYRIIQEALTNVRRHASATHAHVVLRYAEDDVVLEVRDDGRGSAAAHSDSRGHGLIGMRERAALYGGRLETASDEGTGFTVRATLPVAPTRAPA